MDELTLRSARNDAAYALVIAAQPDAPAEQLRALVVKLAGAVQDVADIADQRGAELAAPAALALRDALSVALSGHTSPSLAASRPDHVHAATAQRAEQFQR